MTALVTGVGGFIGSTLAESLVESGERVIGIDSFLDYYPRAVKERNLESPLREPTVRAPRRAAPGARASSPPRRMRPSLPSRGPGRGSGELGRRVRDLHRQQHPRDPAAPGSGGGNRASAHSCSPPHPPSTATRRRLPMIEDIPLHPVSPYGVSKLAAEKLCELYFVNHQVPTVSLRYFTVYGPRQRPDMAFHRLLKCALEGTPFHLFGDGGQTRDFTFIADAVAATIAASERGRARCGLQHRRRLAGYRCSRSSRRCARSPDGTSRS